MSRSSTTLLLHKSKHLLNTTATQCQTLLKSYVASGSSNSIKQLHAHAIVSRLLTSGGQLKSNFATGYAACDYVPYARKLFDEIPERSLFLYNLIVRVLVRNGLLVDAVKVFVEMLDRGEQSLPDHFTYPFVVKACGELGWVRMGGVLHGRLFRDGFCWGVYVQNSLMAMYLNWGCVEEAKKVFDDLADKSVSSWNTMISGYFRYGYAELALLVYDQMVCSGVEPDLATVVSVLPACGVLDSLDVGRRVHEVVKEKGMGSDITVRNALIDMYLKCSSVDEARLIFDGMEQKDVITWSSMVNGYVLNGNARNALALCRLMQTDGVVPNSVTITSLLSACGNLHSLKDGKSLHGWATRRNLATETIVESSLIDMYAKCKRVDLSSQVLNNMPKKTVSWNALISGCVQNELVREAILHFKHMLREAIYPDCATFLSLLPAYASSADTQQGVNIHGYILKFGLLPRSEVATGLVDIYAKCGQLDYAQKVFFNIPDAEKDIVSWSAIIAGCGKHGYGESAISLFDQMVSSGVKPNEITFTSTLHACSHAGLVDKGVSLFKLLTEDCQTTPRMDHYACIVDLLGRAGRLDEAFGMINTMPYKANHSVWGALLGACVIHENVELGEAAASKLFELEPENTGNSVLLAKIYAAAGRWKDAERVRGITNEIGLVKAPAESLIAIRS